MLAAAAARLCCGGSLPAPRSLVWYEERILFDPFLHFLKALPLLSLFAHHRPSLSLSLSSKKKRVDLGGGTAFNVQSMLTYLPLECFAAIYVVDLAGPLCEQAQRKVDAFPGWKGVVHVVHSDATTFVPFSSGLGSVDLVTFSYSLSMMPPFLDAVDHAAALLKPGTG